MAPTTSKPKTTFVSSKNNNYNFLCAATPTSLNTVRKRHGLSIARKASNGNIFLQCTNQSRRNCKYRALFVAQEKAIYLMAGRAHNHPVKGKAEAATQQDHHQNEDESEDDDDNESIDEDQKEEEAMEGEEEGQDGEPPIKQEEEANEEPVVVEEKRFLADIHGEQHLDQLCRAMNNLQEKERIFECKHPNCPFRLSFDSKQSKLYVINQHNH